MLSLIIHRIFSLEKRAFEFLMTLEMSNSVDIFGVNEWTSKAA